MNYTNFILSLLMLILLVTVAVLLFRKLEVKKLFNISMFLILLVFWFAQAVVANGVTDNYVQGWEWPIMVGVHRLAHALTAVPLAMLGRKIKSRKIPLIIMGGWLAITIFINFGMNQNVTSASHWSVYLMMIASGQFVATTGMQNLMWAENWNLRKVFYSMGLMTLAPAIADVLNKTFLTYPSIDRFEVGRWVLLGSAILVVIAMACFAFFVKENKSLIRSAPNEFDEDKKVAEFRLRRVLFNSVGIFLAAIAFELVRSTAVTKFFLINSFNSDDTTITTLLVSVTTSLVAIFVSLFLIGRFKSYNLTIIAKLITVASLVFGLIVVSTDFLNIGSWIVFLVFSSFGMSMYLAVTFGVMMHFHMHSKILVLPIWLAIRIFGMFIGQIVSNEWLNFAGDKNEAMMFIFITSLAIALLGLAWTTYRYLRNEHLIYNMVDKYEFKAKKNVKHSKA